MKFPALRLLLPGILLSAGVHAGELIVKVHDVSVQKGRLMMAVFDSADAWNGKGKAIARQAQTASAASVEFSIAELPSGTYAVSVMHDENGNGSLDNNFLGMPVEGYGFSNDPKVMRKATFEEAAFPVGAEGARIELHLR